MDNSFIEEGQGIHELLFSSNDMDGLGERDDDTMGVIDNENTTGNMILDEPFGTSLPLSDLTTSSLAMGICLQGLDSMIGATFLEPNSNLVLPGEEDHSLSLLLLELDSDMCFFSMDEPLQELVLQFNLPIILPRHLLTLEIIELLSILDLTDFEDNDAEIESWLNLDGVE